MKKTQKYQNFSSHRIIFNGQQSHSGITSTGYPSEYKTISKTIKVVQCNAIRFQNLRIFKLSQQLMNYMLPEQVTEESQCFNFLNQSNTDHACPSLQEDFCEIQLTGYTDHKLASGSLRCSSLQIQLSQMSQTRRHFPVSTDWLRAP